MDFVVSYFSTLGWQSLGAALLHSSWIGLLGLILGLVWLRLVPGRRPGLRVAGLATL